MHTLSEITRDQAREQLLDQVFAADTLEAVARARLSLRQWLFDHPEEQGMRDGFEALSHREDYLDTQELETQEAVPAASVNEAAEHELAFR